MAATERELLLDVLPREGKPARVSVLTRHHLFVEIVHGANNVATIVFDVTINAGVADGTANVEFQLPDFNGSPAGAIPAAPSVVDLEKISRFFGVSINSFFPSEMASAEEDVLAHGERAHAQCAHGGRSFLAPFKLRRTRMFKELKVGFLMMVVMTAITGIVYPAVITIIAQGLFRDQANGSLITSTWSPRKVIARFEGVAPNMSVRISTPASCFTRAIAITPLTTERRPSPPSRSPPSAPGAELVGSGRPEQLAAKLRCAHFISPLGLWCLTAAAGATPQPRRSSD